MSRAQPQAAAACGKIPAQGSGSAAVAFTMWRAARPEAETGVFPTPRETADLLAAESPLTLRVEGRVVAVIMRTPGHDRELAAGFLLAEEVIRSAADVFEISVCPSLAGAGMGISGPAVSPPGGAVSVPSGAGDLPSGTACGSLDSGDSVDIILARPDAWDPERLTRQVLTSSSCGVCSRTSLAAAILPERVLVPGAGPLVSAETLAGLPAALRAVQPAFALTGGLHGCAWWCRERREILPGMVFEDVGRHNALDKLLGHALLTGKLPLSGGALILSGRISYELVQKAHAAGIPLIAAVGAPSSLAVDFARAAGITLCGFLRSGSFNLYSFPERVGSAS